MSGNLDQATLKNFGFTWRVEHRGEDIDINIPDHVLKTCLATSVIAKDTSIEAPTDTTNTVSSFITPLAYVSTTVFSSADPSTCSLNEGSTSSVTTHLTSEEPKIRRRRIKHSALFRAEVNQKKEEGATTAELINI